MTVRFGASISARTEHGISSASRVVQATVDTKLAVSRVSPDNSSRYISYSTHYVFQLKSPVLH